jgi:hypothetical protein
MSPKRGTKMPRAAVLEEVLERAAHHREGELVPRELLLGREPHFQALDAGDTSGSRQARRNIMYTWLMCGIEYTV